MREILSTPRLVLREIGTGDLAALHAIYGDPECMRYYPAPKSYPETQEWFRTLAFDNYARNGFGLWAVTMKDSGSLVGDCGITLQRTPRGLEPEIGYHLRRDVWRQGFATEAALACRDYAIGTLRMPRVVSITSPENLPSRRVAEKVHQRMEVFSKISAATGREVVRYLYVTERP